MEKDILGDEELQMLQKRFEVVHPKVRCPYNNEITNLCTNKTCKSASAMFCDQDTCKSCQVHLACQNVKLRSITKLLQQRADIQRLSVTKMYEIENTIIQSIKKSRIVQLERNNWITLEYKYQEILQQFYINQKYVSLKPTLADEFFNHLRQTTSELESCINISLKQFAQNAQKIALSLKQFKENVIRQLSFVKEFDLKTLLQGSKIIKDNPDQIKFIYDALNKPTKLKLLFRGSQNAFLAKQFHQVCDNISHTFTLIRTEFGKTIAGFTPLCWKSPQKSQFESDMSKQSFLLSIDLKQKMILINYEQAIRRNHSWGPMFGAGWDLALADRCDTNNCTANFPTSYNCKELYYNNQQSYTAFSGATNGYNFRVIQYEVYRVYW